MAGPSYRRMPLPAAVIALGMSDTVRHRLRRGEPYLMMELLLPVGTLRALLLWLYRRRRH